MTALRRSIAVALVAAAVAAPVTPVRAADVAPAEATLPAAAWTAIRRVIDDQLKALRAGDGTKAFS